MFENHYIELDNTLKLLSHKNHFATVKFYYRLLVKPSIYFNMKKFLFIIILLCTITANADSKEIIAEVVFENKTDIPVFSGTFFITELGKEIEINSTESFKITLPEKGKYQFGFYTEDFTSYTYYPARITSRKNTITIRLEKKIETKKNTGFNLDPNDLGVGMNFIYNGLNNNPIDFSDFIEAYGVGRVTKNCVVDPITMKRVKAHNQKVVEYLLENFGEEWRDNLPATPFGLKKE